MGIGISAIIPVREGSTRLKHKNILPFGESNLLIHKIRQLKKVAGIDEIIVSSDSELMLEMARSEGVATHRRAREFADERTKSFSELIEHLASEVGNKEHILYVPCVCPLCDEKDLENAKELTNMVAVQKEYMAEAIQLLCSMLPKDAINTAHKTESSTQNESDWLTIDEAAARFKLSKNNLKDRQWRIRNNFPTRQPNGIYGRVMFNAKDVQEWLNKRKC